MIIEPPKPGLEASPMVRGIREEGDQLAQRLAAMHAVKDAYIKNAPPLDAHMFTVQMEIMQSYLHILTIRLARANDAATGIIPDTSRTLGKKPSIIKPGDIN